MHALNECYIVTGQTKALDSSNIVIPAGGLAGTLEMAAKVRKSSNHVILNANKEQ